MSTKTTFKRVALVAVAALGFGTLSVAPSNAYTVEAGFRTLSWGATPAATGTTLVEWSGVVKVNGSCGEAGNGPEAVFATTTAQLDGAPIGSNLLMNSPTWSTGTPTGYTNTNATAAVAAFSADFTGYRKATQVSCINGSSAMVGYSTVKFTPDKAGVYTLVMVPLGATTGALATTITVTEPTQKFATAFINTNLGAESTADAESLAFTAPANVTAKARVTVKQYSTADATTLTTNTISKDVVVAISKGLVSKTNDYFAAAKSVTTATATGSTSQYYVFANGEVGSADLTVTVGGTLVSTKKITFQGLAATMTAALASANTWIAPTGTATLTVGSKDSTGNASSNTPAITATSATTSVATVVATNSTLVTITGVAAGTSVITIADAAGTATSATYTVTVAPAASATLPTITFDKAEYNAGELMTITIGAAAADNATFAAFTAAPTTSVNVVTVKNPFTGGAVALVSGKATWTAYAPITAGPITVTATSSGGSSATAAAVTATATVLTDGVAQAAADAAAEAIDAANAATDAANAAAEAADAATAAAQDAADAVAALSVQVSEQIAELKAQNEALRKQLIALTNLIIKIQKKVKA